MNVLIFGATRGLGASLTKHYADLGNFVFATSRSSPPESSKRILFIEDIDIAKVAAGAKLVDALKLSVNMIDLVIITAGYFATETFDQPDFENEV